VSKSEELYRILKRKGNMNKKEKKEEGLLPKEVLVKNFFNSINIKSFKEKDIDIFVAITYKIALSPNKEIIIEQEELRKLTGMGENVSISVYNAHVNELLEKLQGSTYVYFNDKTNEKVYVNILEYMKINVVTGDVTIKATPFFQEILEVNIKEGGFFSIDVNLNLILSGKYTKIISLMLQQWNNFGRFYISKEKLYEKLQLSEKANVKYVNNEIIMPAVKQLGKQFIDLKVEKMKKGRSITGYLFTFQTHKKIAEQAEPLIQESCSEPSLQDIEKPTSLIDENIRKYFEEVK